MNHPSHPSRNSMCCDFLTFGNDEIGLNRAFERHAEEQARNRVAASLGTPGDSPSPGTSHLAAIRSPFRRRNMTYSSFVFAGSSTSITGTVISH